MLIPGHPICISYSRIRPVHLCWHNFIQSYGLSGENADYGNNGDEDAYVGTVLHALDAGYVQHCWDRRRVSDWTKFEELSIEAIGLLPEHRQAKAREIADRLRDSTEIDLKADDYLLERRLAISWPDCTPVAPGTPVDRVEGTWDQFVIYPRRGVLRDAKFGYSRHAGQMAENASRDLQMLVYAFMAFHMAGYEYARGKVFPVLDQVDGYLNFKAFRGPPAAGEWTRETIETLEIDFYGQMMTVRQILASSFEQAVSKWKANGTAPGVVTPHWDVCRWCRLACPRWQDVRDRYPPAVKRPRAASGGRKVVLATRTADRPVRKVSFGGK